MSTTQKPKLTKPEYLKFKLTPKQLWALIERKREIALYIKTNGKKEQL